MKQFFTGIILVFLLLLLPPAEVFAASENTYYLDEPDISISLPDDLVVFTRNIDENDPNLPKYGWDKNSLYSMFLSKSIYLNAWDKETTCEIIVTFVNSQNESLDQCTDEELLSYFYEYAADECQEMGIEYIRSEIYHNDKTKFLKSYIRQPNPYDDSYVYGLEYSTVYDYKTINVTLQSYYGAIDESLEAYLKAIVDSIEFHPISQYEEPFTDDYSVPEDSLTTDRSSMDIDELLASEYSTTNLDDSSTTDYSSIDIDELLASDSYTTNIEDSYIQDEVVPKSEAVGDSTFYHVIVSFFITMFLSTMPLCFYRFVIKRTPVKPQKAAALCILSGLITFSITSILILRSGFNIIGHCIVTIFLALVNYQFLIYKNKAAKTAS